MALSCALLFFYPSSCVAAPPGSGITNSKGFKKPQPLPRPKFPAGQRPQTGIIKGPNTTPLAGVNTTPRPGTFKIPPPDAHVIPAPGKVKIPLPVMQKIPIPGQRTTSRPPVYKKPGKKPQLDPSQQKGTYGKPEDVAQQASRKTIHAELDRTSSWKPGHIPGRPGGARPESPYAAVDLRATAKRLYEMNGKLFNGLGIQLPTSSAEVNINDPNSRWFQKDPKTGNWHRVKQTEDGPYRTRQPLKVEAAPGPRN